MYEGPYSNVWVNGILLWWPSKSKYRSVLVFPYVQGKSWWWLVVANRQLVRLVKREPPFLGQLVEYDNHVCEAHSPSPGMWRKRCFADWLAHPTSGSPPSVRANGFLQWDVALPSRLGICPHFSGYSSALLQVPVYTTALLRAYQISTVSLCSLVVCASVMAGSLPKFKVCILGDRLTVFSPGLQRYRGSASHCAISYGFWDAWYRIYFYPTWTQPPEVLPYGSLDVTVVI